MSLPALNFPSIQFRFKHNNKGTLQVFDVIRKKFVDLTPEEWVRQHLVHFLINEKQVSPSIIAIEKQFLLNNTKRRFDVLVYTSDLKPLIIVECKAPEVEINQSTVNQALRYNLELKVPFVFLSNGLQHIFMDLRGENPIILKNIPSFLDLLNS